MTTNRTPGPWRHHTVRNFIVGAAKPHEHEDDGPDIAKLSGMNSRTDGPFIVRACNAHDDLVAALERASWALDHITSWTAVPEAVIDFINKEDAKVRAALAKVKS